MKLYLLPFFICLPLFIQAQNAISLCKEMLTVISGMQTLTMKMESYERTGGEFTSAKFFLKRSRKPLNIYYKQISPNNKVEILYKNGKLLVNPGSFPWVTLDLEVNSTLVRKDQHHSILDSGYDHFVMVLSELFRKYSDSLYKNVVVSGTEKISDKTCYKISFSNPNYKIYSYKTSKAETPLSLASSLKIPEYKICELNNIANVTDKIPAGTTVKLPNDYAKGMVLWLDQKSSIPLKMEISDEKGLYEKYIFTDVVINPVFKSNEFERNFPGYNFK